MLGRVTFLSLLVGTSLSLGSMTALAGGGCRVPEGTTEGAGDSVSMKGCTFGPQILRAPVGATVTWLNSDPVPHAVNGLGWDATPPYGATKPSEKVSHTFAVAGIYPYMCYIHPGMAGIVIVGDATTGAPGTGATLATDGGAPALAATEGLPSVALPLVGLLVLGAALTGYGVAAYSGGVTHPSRAVSWSSLRLAIASIVRRIGLVKATGR